MTVYKRLPRPINGVENKLKSVDIRDTLNHFGGKVTNKTSTFFTADANINRWSKHKPIVTNFKDEVILSYDSDKWDNQQGYAPRIMNNSRENRITAWQGSTEDEWFPYTPPKGGEDEPRRKGDFRGYRADATSPFREFHVDNRTTTYMDETKFTIYMRYFLNNDDDEVEGGMLSLSDMKIMDDTWNTMKVGVIDNFNGEYTIYEGDSISSNWGYAHVNIDWKDSVNYKGWHEFAAILISSDGYIYPLPFSRIRVNVAESNVDSHFNMMSATYSTIQLEARVEILWGTEEEGNLVTDVQFDLTNAEGAVMQSFTSNNKVNVVPGSYGYADLVVSPYDLYSATKQMAENGELYCQARINNFGWISNRILVQTTI